MTMDILWVGQVPPTNQEKEKVLALVEAEAFENNAGIFSASYKQGTPSQESFSESLVIMETGGEANMVKVARYNNCEILVLDLRAVTAPKSVSKLLPLESLKMALEGVTPREYSPAISEELLNSDAQATVSMNFATNLPKFTINVVLINKGGDFCIFVRNNDGAVFLKEINPSDTSKALVVKSISSAEDLKAILK